MGTLSLLSSNRALLAVTSREGDDVVVRHPHTVTRGITLEVQHSDLDTTLDGDMEDLTLMLVAALAGLLVVTIHDDVTHL